jgi:hypothetical protein
MKLCAQVNSGRRGHEDILILVTVMVKPNGPASTDENWFNRISNEC